MPRALAVGRGKRLKREEEGAVQVSQVCDAEGGGADRITEFVLGVAWGYRVVILLLLFADGRSYGKVVVAKILHLVSEVVDAGLLTMFVSNTILQHELLNPTTPRSSSLPATHSEQSPRTSSHTDSS